MNKTILCHKCLIIRKKEKARRLLDEDAVGDEN